MPALHAHISVSALDASTTEAARLVRSALDKISALGTEPYKPPPNVVGRVSDASSDIGVSIFPCVIIAIRCLAPRTRAAPLISKVHESRFWSQRISMMYKIDHG
jgi:hypothetical protein